MREGRRRRGEGEEQGARGVSAFSGLECWTGVLEWNHWNGVKHSGPVTTYKWNFID